MDTPRSWGSHCSTDVSNAWAGSCLCCVVDYKENIQVAAAGAWREKLQLLDWLGDEQRQFVALATGARCWRSSSSWRRREIKLQLVQLAGDRVPVGAWCWRSSSGPAGAWC